MMRESARKGSAPTRSILYRASPPLREDAIMTRRDGRSSAGAFGRIMLAAMFCIPLAACSFSMPLSPFGATPDPITTGSIGPVSPLADAHDREDWRRARAALAVALDPQGPGTRVGWQNPETGNAGAFESASNAYVRDDRVCRDFAADLSFAAAAPRRGMGIACRMSEANWHIDSFTAQDNTTDAL